MTQMTSTNRLAKWRRIFMNWQIGNAPKGHLEGDAIVHHRELSMILRAECNALAALLIQKGVFSQIEFTAQTEVEAEHLATEYEKLFPGLKVTDDGITTTDLMEGARTLDILYRHAAGPLIRKEEP